MNIDPSGYPWILFMIIVGLALAGGSAYARHKRMQAMQAGARARGWLYLPRDDAALRAWSNDLFRRGYKRKTENVITGRHGNRDFIALDYTYYTKRRDSEGRTRTTSHTYGVIALSTGRLYPRLTIDTEGVFDRIANVVTNSDIELESEPFNRTFTVHCEDRKFAYDVLHPRMMQMLLDRPPIPWTFDNAHIMSIESRCAGDVDAIAARLDALAAVVEQIPPLVSDGHPTAPAA